VSGPGAHARRGIIDSHCHLDSQQFNEDRDEVVQRALDAGIAAMVAIGTGDGPPDLEVAVRLAEHYDALYATVGVHPHDAGKADYSTFVRLRELARHPKVVGFGEIGVDYHYDFSPREAQKSVFREQLAIARDVGLPVIIHTREAWDDTFSILEEQPPAHGGVMHCFSGGPEEARRSLALGFHLSFGGIVTFPKSIDIQAAAREAPADRILVETDAPYLAPVPRRGKRNEPAFIVHTVAKLAELRGTTPEEIAVQTATNFETLCLRRLRPDGC
jgi:TatD DNase family protein